MARSSGSIHVADNSVTSINDAIQQLLFMMDELRGEHSSTTIRIGPHTHAGGTTGTDTGAQDGGPITPATIDHDDLINVTTDQHHAKLHETLHRSGGADALKIDDLASPDDNTDLNASTTAHGLLRKLDGSATVYLDGSGSWSTPAGSGGSGSEATDVSHIDGETQGLPFEEIMAGKNITITELASGNAIKVAATDVIAYPQGATWSKNGTTVGIGGTAQTVTDQLGNFSVGHIFTPMAAIVTEGARVAWNGTTTTSIKLSLYNAGVTGTGSTLLDTVTVSVSSAAVYSGTWPNGPHTLDPKNFYKLQAYETSGTYYPRWNNGSASDLGRVGDTIISTLSYFHAGDAVIDTSGTDRSPLELV